MAVLHKVLLGLAALVLIAAAGLCGWFFLYSGDLPKTEQLSEFAPPAGHLAWQAGPPTLKIALKLSHWLRFKANSAPK